MRRAALALVLLGLALAPRPASAAALRRLALVAGANRATPDRVPLRYAVSDAERFAAVATRMGGVAPDDCLTLREPTRQAFLDGLAILRGRVGAARAQAERVEVLLYYSGHADEKGLLLGKDLVAYRELRDGLSALSADVAVAVLDACASGAITRLKGGQAHPAFMTDVNSQTSGYAFLTSSAENEAAQESERIGGSFFTHALLSGLRGGADASGDGKVTLGEAYQFAFQETLAQTAPTEAGAQHPSWDIKMTGTGDVVMTDVRQTSSSLILESDMEGRFFVRNARRQLVAELFKPAGRSVELGLEPGEYEVHFDQPAAYFKTRLSLADGQRRVLVRQELAPSRRVLTRRRGGWEAPAGPRGLALEGRSRVEMRFGFSEGGVRVNADQQTTDVTGGQFALSGLHWLREDLALEIAFRMSDLDVSTRTRIPTEMTDTSGVMSFLFGARLYAPASRSGAPFRPYVAAAVGPHTDVRVRTGVLDSSWGTDETNLALHLGGGIDLLLGRHFVLGAYTGTTLRSGHETRLGGGLVMGWGFGRGRSRD